MFNKNMSQVAFTLLLAGAAVGFTPAGVHAEVQSRECPYNCQDAGIPRAQCKDWQADGKCFVEDLRDSSARGALGTTVIDEEDNLDRRIVMVEKVISDGGRETLRLESKPVRKIDVVLRRQQGSGTETQLSATIEGASMTAAPKQIDRDENHVLSWDLADKRTEGRKLVLNAMNGEVYVESVHVFYEQ